METRSPLGSSRTRSIARPVGSLLTLLLFLVAATVLSMTAWQRWAPVPEVTIPPGGMVRQWSTTTCGPAAVATVLNAHGRAWSQRQLEQECRLTAQGTSLYDLREALRRRGLRADGFQATEPTGLLRVPRPYIAHLTQGHFVVVTKLREKQLEVFDPSTGWVKPWTPEELHRSTRGGVLSATPR